MARKKGRQGAPNLIRTDDYIINKYDVKISHDEARRLENLVRRVNRKRAAMEKAFSDKPLYYGRQRLDESREQLRLMGEEMDIMIRKRSASLHQFASRGSFNKYMKSLERAAATDYIEYRAKLYKRNYMKALQENYGEYPELLKGVLMKVRMMKPADFVEWVGTDRLGQIKFHYDVGGKVQRLNDLRDRVGLRDNGAYRDVEEMEEY